MAKILKADIKQGTPIEPWHISQFANALTAKEPYDLSVLGSLTISGSTYLKPSGILRTPQEYLLSFNNTTGQIFKSSIVDISNPIKELSVEGNEEKIITLKQANGTILTASFTDMVLHSDSPDTTYTAGEGVELNDTVFSHKDTSNATSTNNSGRTYIQNLTLDNYGHITDIETSTETVTDTVGMGKGFKISDSNGGNHFTIVEDSQLKLKGEGATGIIFDQYTNTITITSNNTDTRYNSSHFVDLTSDQDNIGGVKTFTNESPSTSKTSGAVTVTGGVGIGGDLNVGGEVISSTSSDRNLKDNIQNIESPIDKLKQLNGVTWDWNKLATPTQQTLPSVGVIAQDVEKVLPQLVTTGDSGFKSVDYPKLVALLIESIKDQQKQIDELKNK